MKASLIAAMLVAVSIATAGEAVAGGKAAGSKCHTGKSCASKSCVRLSPVDKFGVCCQAQDCASLNAQCGQIDNGCGVPIGCGECSTGFCVDNQCVGSTTTTTTTTTSTTTTSTTTTSSTTTTTNTNTTTTTLGATTTTTLSGPCPSGMVFTDNFCWMLSASDGSCTEACTSQGLTCDETAVQSVGSSGTNSDCSDIIDLLAPSGAPYTAEEYSQVGCGLPESNSIGCVLQPFFALVKRVVHSIPTTCSAGNDGPLCFLGGQPQRACPCSVP